MSVFAHHGTRSLGLLGVLSAAAFAGSPPTDPSIPGTWRGMMTADGLTLHLRIEVEPAGEQFVGDGLLWCAMAEDDAVMAGFGALPPGDVHPRAQAVSQQFHVRLEQDRLTFAGRRAKHLIHFARYHPDTFSGPLRPPGVVIGTPRDANHADGIFQLWKEGALRNRPPLELQRGRVHHLGTLDPSPYHYRCYIPAGYDPANPIAVLINISPTGNARPLLPELAEELNWLMAGLTEASNGPMPPNLENLNAVFFDLRRRFNVDLRRVYFSGFSGGARLATWAGINHPETSAGLICIGAGYYEGPPPRSQPICFIVGRTDYNHKEVVTLFEAADRTTRQTRLLIHPGGHTWGRPQDHAEAIRWLDGLRRKPND